MFLQTSLHCRGGEFVLETLLARIQKTYGLGAKTYPSVISACTLLEFAGMQP